MAPLPPIQYLIKYQNYPADLVNHFKQLRTDQNSADATLVCDGQQSFRAHRIVLSMSSQYLKALLEIEPKSKQALIILTNVNFIHMEGLLDFMYTGQVVVPGERLGDFLKAAQILHVKGLQGIQLQQVA